MEVIKLQARSMKSHTGVLSKTNLPNPTALKVGEIKAVIAKHCITLVNPTGQFDFNTMADPCNKLLLSCGLNRFDCACRTISIGQKS